MFHCSRAAGHCPLLQAVQLAAPVNLIIKSPIMTEQSDNKVAPSRKKASIGQVAATMFWALFMIGKKGTWERDGATITLAQAVIGGIIMCIVVVFLLIALTRFAVS